MTKIISKFFDFLPRLWTNWITLLGSIITTLAGAALLLATAVELASGKLNTYLTTIVFLVLPTLFVVGLLLIPIGFTWERRRRPEDLAPGESLQATFVAAMKSPIVRRRIFFVLGATFVNVLLIGFAGEKAVSFMDSPRFCGTVCHRVMEPEYDAYLRSPHQRVPCVECHIGPGASWAVKSKVSGMRQVWKVLTGTEEKPIHTPVRNLRPARDTCERCHWPEKFQGNRVAFRVSHDDDEANTPLVSALILRVGGRNPTTRQHEGIHWHVSHAHQVRYQALDDRRRVIGRIERIEDGKVVATYLPPGDKAGPPRETRIMDCVDCHNRPTHIFDGSPADAVDRALNAGLLDAKVPYLRKVAVAALASGTPPRAQAQAFFREALAKGYAGELAGKRPDDAALDAAAATLAQLYRENVYPDMKLTWDTYDSHIGHAGPEGQGKGIGCFRCHDDEHKTADGKTLSADCDQCHEIVAMDARMDEVPDSLRPLIARHAAIQAEPAAEAPAPAPEAAADEGATDTGSAPPDAGAP